ncbi:MAG TPA: hypothetical protein VIQ23_12340 [Hanamia sp.]
MDAIKELEKDLLSGFSKRDLETLIGLPQNSLSNVLSGKKKLSKKSVAKIEKWSSSEKPDPFFLPGKKGDTEKSIKDFTKPSNVIKPFDQPKTNYAITTYVPGKEMPSGLSKIERFKWLKDNS